MENLGWFILPATDNLSGKISLAGCFFLFINSISSGSGVSDSASECSSAYMISLIWTTSGSCETLSVAIIIFLSCLIFNSSGVSSKLAFLDG